MRLGARIGAVAAGWAVFLLLAIPAGPQVHAGGDLVTVADTTYQVLPNEARVHVTIDARSTSNAQGVYFTGISFAIPPAVSNLRGASGGTSLLVEVAEETEDFTGIEVTFSRGVFYRQTYAFQVSFDMVDTGGAANRDLRIGRSVVAFPVWAFGSEGVGGGSVLVILPPTYRPTLYGEGLVESTAEDGSIHLATSSITDPYAFFVYVTAERPGIFRDTDFTVDIGEEEPAEVRVRAWEDDPDWGVRVQGLMTDGLPVLRELVGLPWPVNGVLKVEEAATRRLGEYAGIYNPATELMTVRYDADGIVTLHEAAHVWFNSRLLPERWIGEAWAEFYAVQAAEQIDASGVPFTLDDELLAVRFPLNEWGGIGRGGTAEESFAYAATYHLAVLIFERTDHDGLRAVWRAIEDGEASYQPVHKADAPHGGVSFGLDGWQRLLDLLDERTAGDYTDLWSEWVVGAAQQALLEDRDAARARYEEVVLLAGDWELPEEIRFEIGAWDFDDLGASLDAAVAVLGDRERIASLAVTLDLTPPDDLQAAFEGSDGLTAGQAEADRELLALTSIQDAGQALDSEPSILESVGLLLSDPDADLAVARDMWEAGDSDGADGAADAVLALREGAEAAGRDRLLYAGGGVLLIGGGTAAVLLGARRRTETSAARPAANQDESARGAGGA